MQQMLKVWFWNWEEKFREWLAWKIFPEQGIYIEAIKRMAQVEENERCIKILEDSESGCSEWAIHTIKIKYTNLMDILDKYKDEPPF